MGTDAVQLHRIRTCNMVWHVRSCMKINVQAPEFLYV